MISTISLTGFAENKIELPQQYILNIQPNGNYKIEKSKFLKEEYIVAFSPQGAVDIAKIYQQYINLVEQREEFDNLITNYQSEVKILNKEISIFKLSNTSCKIILNKVQEDRKEIYDLYKKELREKGKEERRNKIKRILFTGGGVLTGVGVGILLGAFLI
jgi:Icc-related predicted phosphoesterase